MLCLSCLSVGTRGCAFCVLHVVSLEVARSIRVREIDRLPSPDVRAITGRYEQ